MIIPKKVKYYVVAINKADETPLEKNYAFFYRDPDSQMLPRLAKGTDNIGITT